MVLVRGGFSTTDGPAGVDTTLSLLTLIYGATYNNTNANGEALWIADPVSQLDAANAGVCTRSGFKVPGRLKRVVEGRAYAKVYAPRGRRSLRPY